MLTPNAYIAARVPHWLCRVCPCSLQVRSFHQARQFTDTANFTLRCGVCLVGIKGEKEAVEHAKQTGHQNFSEY